MQIIILVYYTLEVNLRVHISGSIPPMFFAGLGRPSSSGRRGSGSDLGVSPVIGAQREPSGLSTTSLMSNRESMKAVRGSKSTNSKASFALGVCCVLAMWLL
jgi:hypothetical protein